MLDIFSPVNRMIGGDFRIGRIFDRTVSIYTQNFLLFSLVALAASVPSFLLTYGTDIDLYNPGTANGAALSFLTGILSIVFWLLSQATLVHGAFQDMRGRPVSLYESVNAGLRRFFPLLGVSILVVLAIMSIFLTWVLITLSASFGLSRYSPNFGFSIVSSISFIVVFTLLVAAALILITRWFVAIPVCMVERFGPFRSLKRSSQLTKGQRWKVFGVILVLYIGVSIIGVVIGVTVTTLAGRVAGLIASLVMNTILGAFFAIFVVVTYYELRTAKEGVDIGQIASVFD